MPVGVDFTVAPLPINWNGQGKPQELRTGVAKEAGRLAGRGDFVDP